MRDTTKDVQTEAKCDCGEDCKCDENGKCGDECKCEEKHNEKINMNPRQIIGKANFPRNKKCSCGSGKKYKNCCFEKKAAIRELYAIAKKSNK